MFRAVGISTPRRFGALFCLAGAAEVDDLAHPRRYFSIAFLKAGRAMIRAVYSFSTSVSGVILNSIM